MTHKVYIIESERGWGQRIDEIKEFDSYADAEKFCKAYNNQYNPPCDTTPDWYMFAKLEGDSSFGMLR